MKFHLCTQGNTVRILMQSKHSFFMTVFHEWITCLKSQKLIPVDKLCWTLNVSGFQNVLMLIICHRWTWISQFTVSLTQRNQLIWNKWKLLFNHISLDCVFYIKIHECNYYHSFIQFILAVSLYSVSLS